MSSNHIKYTRNSFTRPTWETIKYGNLMCTPFYGSIDLSEDIDDSIIFNAWLMSDDPNKSDFRLGFGSRAAAARWLNKKLRLLGVK